MLNCSLMECAKEMIRESLPIKCLEAVVLAMYPFDSCHCKATNAGVSQYHIITFSLYVRAYKSIHIF